MSATDDLPKVAQLGLAARARVMRLLWATLDEPGSPAGRAVLDAFQSLLHALAYQTRFGEPASHQVCGPLP